MINKIFSFTTITIGGSITFLGLAIKQGEDRVYQDLLMPVLSHIVEPETAHRMAVNLARYSFLPDERKRIVQNDELKTTFLSLKLSHPIGLAAGFDKDAEGISGLEKLGFSFIEVGSVTPQPQSGNPKPRVFRLREDEAIINRYGFNSAGHECVFNNLTALSKKSTVLGLNLGKNKTTEDQVSDYVKGLEKFAQCPNIDYFVVNISSPNTPGLRDIQKRNDLDKFIDEILRQKDRLQIVKPLLLKISPDLNDQEKKDIADLVIKKRGYKSRIDGLIVSNTTVNRDFHLKSEFSNETGGLSGCPLNRLSTQVIGDMYRLTKGQIPIIGVGGVSNAQDAYDKIKAGASLVQLYSAITFKGPTVVRNIVNQLGDLVKKDGFKNINDAMGANSRK